MICPDCNKNVKKLCYVKYTNCPNCGNVSVVLFIEIGNNLYLCERCNTEHYIENLITKHKRVCEKCIKKYRG